MTRRSASERVPDVRHRDPLRRGRLDEGCQHRLRVQVHVPAQRVARGDHDQGVGHLVEEPLGGCLAQRRVGVLADERDLFRADPDVRGGDLGGVAVPPQDGHAVEVDQALVVVDEVREAPVEADQDGPREAQVLPDELDREPLLGLRHRPHLGVVGDERLEVRRGVAVDNSRLVVDDGRDQLVGSVHGESRVHPRGQRSLGRTSFPRWAVPTGRIPGRHRVAVYPLHLRRVGPPGQRPTTEGIR